MLTVINSVLAWVGFLSVAAIASAYMTQKWWRTPVGRFIMTMKVALFILYLTAVVRTIFYPATIRTDAGAVVANVMVSSILAYGAYAFVTTIRHKDDD